MGWFFNESDGKLILQFLKGKLTREDLAFKLLPLFTLEVIRKYLRVQSSGLENVPKKDGALIICNHSGYSGFDAMMLSNEIRREHRRIPRLVAHKLWFVGKPVQVVSSKMGLVEADMNHSLEILRKKELLILFPEGEAGNFKPSHRRYRLQEFKRGFVRLAMITGVPIIPSYVIGAEETHINLSQIKFTKYLFGTVIPVPLNVIPLPVKWRIRFLEPIHLEGCTPADALDRKKVFFWSRKIRHIIQKAIIDDIRAHLASEKSSAENPPSNKELK
jgi:1-acyl-sn-glycerol-3-phosphate acyltransferase